MQFKLSKTYQNYYQLRYFLTYKYIIDQKSLKIFYYAIRYTRIGQSRMRSHNASVNLYSPTKHNKKECSVKMNIKKTHTIHESRGPGKYNYTKMLREPTSISGVRAAARLYCRGSICITGIRGGPSSWDLQHRTATLV